MKLKDYEQKIKNEEYVIPDVLSKIETVAYNKTYSVETTKNIPFYKRPIFKFATVVLILAIILTVTLILTSNTTSYDHKYETVGDRTNLTKVLTNTTDYSKSRKKVGLTCAKGDTFDGPVLEETGSDSSNKSEEINNNSNTNNQVSGINEPEIIKYDDNYIYYLYHDKVIIYQRAEKIIYYKTINIDKNVTMNSSKILVKDNLLIVYYSYLNVRPYTEVYIYDTLNDFNLVNNYKVTGTYQDARLMDNTLYLVVVESLYTKNDVVPEYTRNEEKTSVSLDNIIYITNTNNIGYTSLVTINLETFSIHQSTQLGSSYYNTIYMSKNKIYLASVIFNGKRYMQETTIYIYNVTDSDTTFYAFTTFDGQVLDQYSLDEYKGYLRVASTNTNAEVNYYNSIQIFDLNDVNSSSKEINRVGYLNEGIGKPYQTIRSANFNGDRVSVVTYQNRDPLYDIDLSDPKNPKIIGEFEAPGYSSYLHRFNDTYMLGIGYDDSFEPKITLYHNNTENKTYVNYGNDLLFDNYEKDNLHVSYAYTSPRELMFLTIDDKMTFGIPVHIYDHIKGKYLFEYWIYQIDLNDVINPIKLKLRLNADTFGRIDYEMQYVGSLPQYWYAEVYNYNIIKYGVFRALFIDNEFIGITSEGVVVYDKNFNYSYTTINNKK